MVLLTLTLSAAADEPINIKDDVGFAFVGGEMQSTVIGPGQHAKCPAGRILITTDLPVGTTGTIKYRDLTNPPGAVVTSTVQDAPGAGTTFRYGTADHDLVALPNGDILYITGAFSRAPVTPKPAWFDQTYRWDFGPGARTVVLTWRSKNCGETFEYVPELLYDPATENGGWCALPQYPRTFFHKDSTTPYSVPFQSTTLNGEETWWWCVKCQGLFSTTAPSLACAIGGVHKVPESGYEMVTTPLPNDDAGWKRCKNCGGLFSTDGSAASVCGAGHATAKSYHMITAGAAQPGLEEGWQQCARCQGVFLPGTEPSRCPNGAQHQSEKAYRVALESSPLSGESGWRMCTKCRTLFSTSTQVKNVCPAGGAHNAGPSKYEMLQSGTSSVATETGFGSCSLCGALFATDEGGTHCPATRAHDGAGSPDYHLAAGATPAGMQDDWRHCTKCGALHWTGYGMQGCPIAAPGELPKWELGGTDGQLVAVDYATGGLFLSHRCVGYLPDTTVKTHLELSPNHINRTLIGRLQKHDTKWSTTGILEQNSWRTTLVPLENETVIAGIGSWVFPGFKLPGSHFFVPGFEVSSGKAGWDGWTKKLPTISSNIWEYGIMARTPGTNSVFVVYPDSKAGKGHGYRLAFVKDGTFTGFPAQATITEASEHMILPAGGNADDVILHLQAIDLGVGPVLLYWEDINFAASKVTIRGRFVTGPNQFTNDFTISQAGNAPRAYLASPGMWYGDYHTGGGYAGALEYVYKPLWVEPDGVHYGHVEFAKPGLAPPAPMLRARGPKTVKAKRRAPGPASTDEKDYTERQKTRPPRARRGE